VDQQIQKGIYKRAAISGLNYTTVTIDENIALACSNYC